MANSTIFFQFKFFIISFIKVYNLPQRPSGVVQSYRTIAYPRPN